MHREYLFVSSVGAATNITTSDGISHKPLDRGYNFFFWSYVHTVRIAGGATTVGELKRVFSLSKCFASQRKHTSYDQRVIFKASEGIHDYAVEWAHCTCPAGIGGGCQHVVALLFTLDACKRDSTDLPPSQTCTSLERAWGPRRRNIAPGPVRSVVVEKPRYSPQDTTAETPPVKRARTGPMTSTLYESRAGEAKETTFSQLQQLRTSLMSNSATKQCGIVQLLQGHSEERHCLHESAYGPAPFGSCLVYQQQQEGKGLVTPKQWQHRPYPPPALGNNAASPTLLAPQTSTTAEHHPARQSVSAAAPVGSAVDAPTSSPVVSDRPAPLVSHLAERSEEVIALYQKRRREGYDLPRSVCPDYYDWLDSQSAPSVPATSSSCASTSAASVSGHACAPPITAAAATDDAPTISSSPSVSAGIVSSPATCSDAAASTTTETPASSSVPSSFTTGYIQLPVITGRRETPIQASEPMHPNRVCAIERLTQKQNTSEEWHRHRNSRLTASRFHEIVHRRAEVSEKFLLSLFSQNTSIENLLPIKHGRDKEDEAAQNYVRKMQHLGHIGITIYPVGLCLDPDHSFVGASPDRLVHDPTSSPPHGLLEIKCPASLYDSDLTPLEAAHRDDFFCYHDGTAVKLKQNHKYYTQVQGQLGVTGLAWCDFMVWCGENRLSVQRITFNADQWREILSKLVNFYGAHARPYLAKSSK